MNELNEKLWRPAPAGKCFKRILHCYCLQRCPNNRLIAGSVDMFCSQERGLFGSLTHLCNATTNTTNPGHKDDVMLHSERVGFAPPEYLLRLPLPGDGRLPRPHGLLFPDGMDRDPPDAKGKGSPTWCRSSRRTYSSLRNMTLDAGQIYCGRSGKEAGQAAPIKLLSKRFFS